MRMASVVALLLVLNGAEALKTDVRQIPLKGNELAAESPAGQKAQLSAVEPPKIKKGTGDPLNSNNQFVLESEVVPGFFITHRNSSDMGDKDKWLDLRHITGGEWGLIKGVTPEAIFTLQNQHQSSIKSGDMVTWKHGDKEMDLLFALAHENDGEPGYQWPNPLVRKESPTMVLQPHFMIEHARDVDLASIRDRPNTFGGYGWNKEMKADPRMGEEIKDGDSIWMRHKAGMGDADGDWFFMSGDPGEGYHVAFPHHLVGFDGWVQHYAMENWTNANDPHATSSRFTVRKVKSVDPVKK